MEVSSAKFSATQWRVVAVLCAAMLFEGMNLASVNVQLPQVRVDLGLSPDTAQLVAGSYLAAFGGALLLGGRIADRVGRRRSFLTAVAVFGVGSLLTTLAPGAVLLVAGRVVQGLGAAFTVPAAMAIITTTFPEGPLRNRALGLWAAVGGSGYAVGLLVTGTLTQLLGWRAGFGLFLGMSVVIFVSGRLVLTAGTEVRRGTWFRGLGRPLASTLALLIAVYGMGVVGAHPLTAAACLGAASIATGCLVALTRRNGARLVPLALTASRGVKAANLVAFTFFAGVSGTTFVLALYLQAIQHYGPFPAGAVFLPTAVLAMFAAPWGARLVTRRGARLGLVSGAAVVALATAANALIGVASEPLAVIIPVSLIMAVGIALAYPGATIASVGGVPQEYHGIASALVLTSQQLGGAVGIALATVVATAVNGGTLSDDAGDTAGLQAGLLACALLAATGTAAGAVLRTSRTAPRHADLTHTTRSSSDPVTPRDL